MKHTLGENFGMPIEPGFMYWHRVFGYAVRVIECKGRMVRYQRVNSGVVQRPFLITHDEFRRAYAFH